MIKIITKIINSRRLGKSLGIDIIKSNNKKVCNLNCIYCECGFGKTVNERKSWVDFDKAKKELIENLPKYKDIDVVTFSGYGEPTLNQDIGKYIDIIKKTVNKNVCVITNSTLLHNNDVSNDLMKSDIIMPSLDFVSKNMFEEINIPHNELNFQEIIDGLINFSNKYRGKLLLEIFFVEGINTSKEDIKNFIKIIEKIKFSELHLNTVDRVPASNKVKPIDEEILLKIKEKFEEKFTDKVKII